jgi:hypothetical protein
MGLPTQVLSEAVGSFITFENPKSQILKSLLFIRILAGFKSLCIVFYFANY